MTGRFLLPMIGATALAGLLTMSTGSTSVQAQAGTMENPAGALANTCGVPQPQEGRGAAAAPEAGRGGGRGGPPVFPAGQYPVKLPPVSTLGARNDGPNPYMPGVDWGQLPAGRKWGSSASVTTGPDGNMWVADRCGAFGAGGTTCGGTNSAVNPIFEFDPSGKLLKSLGAGLFISPHKLSIDKEGNLWVADNGRADGKGNVILKLDQTGKVLMTLGKPGVVGTGNDEFDAPTEAAIAPNGDIFISDGHSGGGTATGNARIMKFDKTGKFIKSFGRKGSGDGEFDVIHTVFFDSQGRLFVGDRQNNRIQIFDQEGKHIATWYQFGRPSGIYIDRRTDTMYVADSESRDARSNTGQFALPQTAYGYNLGAMRGIRIGSARTGRVTAFIPDPCPYPYPAVSSIAEGVAADFQGNVYGADFLQTVRKFVKK